MSTTVIVAADVIEAAARGCAVLEVRPGQLVTPLAVDEARERRIELRRVSEPPPAAPSAASAAAPGVRRHPVRHVPVRGLALDPFPLPGPPAAMDVRLRDVVTAEHGAPMATGVMSLREGSFPWHLTYDEVQVVLEGELHLGTDDGVIVALPGDVLFVPKDTHVTFGTPSWTKFLYVTYPAEWGGEAAS